MSGKFEEVKMTPEFARMVMQGGLDAVNAGAPFRLVFSIVATSYDEAEVRLELQNSVGLSMRTLFVGSMGVGNSLTLTDPSALFTVKVE